MITDEYFINYLEARTKDKLTNFCTFDEVYILSHKAPSLIAPSGCLECGAIACVKEDNQPRKFAFIVVFYDIKEENYVDFVPSNVQCVPLSSILNELRFPEDYTQDDIARWIYLQLEQSVAFRHRTSSLKWRELSSDEKYTKNHVGYFALKQATIDVQGHIEFTTYEPRTNILDSVTSRIKCTFPINDDDSVLVSLWEDGNVTIFTKNGKPIIAPEDCSDLFSDCLANAFIFNGLDTSKTTNMKRMFANTRAYSIDFTNYFDTNNVTSMLAMFDRSSFIDGINLSSFNTSSCNDMRDLFAESKAKNIDLTGNFELAKENIDGFIDLATATTIKCKTATDAKRIKSASEDYVAKFICEDGYISKYESDMDYDILLDSYVELSRRFKKLITVKERNN